GPNPGFRFVFADQRTDWGNRSGFPPGQVPELDRLTRATRGEHLAIGADRNARHLAAVSLALKQLLAGSGVVAPHVRNIGLGACGKQRLAVGAQIVQRPVPLALESKWLPDAFPARQVPTCYFMKWVVILVMFSGPNRFAVRIER